ncbi:protein S100-A10b [Fundulus heteroclitus]|uniref:protein S100-A10b n=1 Tax=Fundulus heteroclitus TaxID=8078 RepID=UPI00165C86B6|nr:protein S100-A10b [Fundulus heteroclitus]
MSGVLTTVALLKQTFDKYAGADGDKNQMSKKELATMLKAELPGCCDKQSEVNEFLKMLDQDGDGSLSFEEFATFVATFAVLAGSA